MTEMRRLRDNQPVDTAECASSSGRCHATTAAAAAVHSCVNSSGRRSSRRTVPLTTENHGVRSLSNYMSLEEAVAVKRISTTNNRPYLVSDDAEVKLYRRLARCASQDAKAMQERTVDQRLCQSSRQVPTPGYFTWKSEPSKSQEDDSNTSMNNGCVHRRSQQFTRPAASQQLSSLDEVWHQDEPYSRWDQLPKQVLIEVMKRVVNTATSDSIRELHAGNCADVLSSTSVCRNWRQEICYSSELRAELRFSIDERKPFTSQHQNVEPHMLRFIACPPFPLLVRTAAHNGNASACYALAALLDVQQKKTLAMAYLKEAATFDTRRTMLDKTKLMGNDQSKSEADAQLLWLSHAVRDLQIGVGELHSLTGDTLLDLGRLMFDAHDSPSLN